MIGEMRHDKRGNEGEMSHWDCVSEWACARKGLVVQSGLWLVRWKEERQSVHESRTMSGSVCTVLTCAAFCLVAQGSHGRWWWPKKSLPKREAMQG